MKIGKYKITFEVDNDQANSKIKETNTNLEDTKTNMDDVMESGDALSGGLVSNFKNVSKSIGTAIKGLRTLKGVLIATGIGAFAVAVVSVGKAFTNSEEGQNKFAKLMGQIAVVTGNVFDILEDLGNSILSYGKILGNLVTGNLAGAAEAFQDLRDNIGEVVDGVKNFGEETQKEIKIAGELADARAKADKIERELLVDRAKADRERAELLEKAVNREKFSTEERIQFLKDASAVDEEITNKEIALAKIRLDAKVAENALAGSTKEDLEEEAQLRANVIQLETAKLSKQKEVTSQTIALINEEKAANKAKTDKDNADREKELAAEEAFLKASRELLATSEEEKLELLKIKEQEKFDALIEQAGEHDEIRKDLEEAKVAAIQKIQDDADAAALEKQKIANQKKLDEDQKQADQEKAIKQSQLDAAVELSALGIGLLAEGSNAAKALGIANAIISTYSGAAQVLDDPELPLFAKIAGVATVLATGFQQVRAVQQTEIPVLSVGGVTAGAGSGASGVPQIQPPSFNVVGASPINQLTEAISGQSNQPIRAYVVANDVTTAQSVDRNIVQTAGI